VTEGSPGMGEAAGVGCCCGRGGTEVDWFCHVLESALEHCLGSDAVETILKQTLRIAFECEGTKWPSKDRFDGRNRTL
jgi:hypothetical protein